MSLGSINICVWGLDLDVDYYYTKGYADTLEEPGEPEGIEINEIRFIAGVEHDHNLAELGHTEEELQESRVFLEAVEQDIWDSFEYNREHDNADFSRSGFDYDDYRDNSYFDSEPEVEW